MKYIERHRIILVIIVIAAVVLTSNLFYLQVIKSEYRRAARDRTLYMQSIFSPRGNIYDRNDEFIVVNQPSYELEMIYNELDPEMDIDEFCRLLGISIPAYQNLMEEAVSKKYFRKYLPIRFMTNIDPESFSILQEHFHKFPGFYPITKSKRQYPLPYASHVFGFLREVNSEDIKNSDNRLEIGELMGATGIEMIYDQVLRGTKGHKYILRDNVGRRVESFQGGLLDTVAAPGSDITVSLDIFLQEYGEKLMANKRGSIVAIDPQSGEVLALISSPAYDPNLLSVGQRRNETFLNLLRDTINRPMINRALQAKYPPGSIFKTVLSLAALQEGILTPDRSIPCSGEYVINKNKGFVQGCRDHPSPRNVEIALQYSCNTYYYQVLREFLDQFGMNNSSEGLDLLNKYLYQFGLGQRLGIDLDNENPGFLPTSDFYNEMYNTPEYSWRSTYILSLGIGQGEFEFTTLQMANLAAAIANRGYFYRPHLIKNFNSEKNEIPSLYKEKNKVQIDSVHFETIVQAMEKVVSSGTARRAYVPGVEICGKTGTSQNPHGEDHSVFFGFAPKDNPQIALAVYIENAGGGGAFAAPVGGLMIEKYLRKEISSYRKSIEERISNLNLIQQDVP